MYAAATTYWAITVSSLIQAVNEPDEPAFLGPRSASTLDRVLTACLGLNVSGSVLMSSVRAYQPPQVRAERYHFDMENMGAVVGST